METPKLIPSLFDGSGAGVLVATGGGGGVRLGSVVEFVRVRIVD